MKRVGIYVRCSTQEQNTERQVYELKEYLKKFDDLELTEVYNEVGVSGSKKNRPEYDRMMVDCRSGKLDVILSLELSRLGRSTRNLCEFVDEMKELGIDLIIKNQSINTSTPAGMLFFHMISCISEFESEILKERIKSSLAHRKARGYKLGRPSQLTDEKREQVIYLRSKGMGFTKISKKLRIGTHTIYKCLKEAV